MMNLRVLQLICYAVWDMGYRLWAIVAETSII